MSQKPYISRRHAIQWSSDPFSEPTSTLVLSSALGTFVDIRLFLTHPPAIAPDGIGPYVTQSAFEPGSYFRGLEWANAGLARYGTRPDGKRTGEWSHEIDNLGKEGMLDTGVMEQRGGATWETGAMENLETGKVTPYVEIWLDVPIRVPPPRPGAKPSAGKRSFALIRCENKEKSTKGCVVWVGQYCQGIIRHGDQVAVERWEFDSEARGGQGEWARTFRHGHGAVPCGWLVLEADEIKKGEILKVPDLGGTGDRWYVEEEDFSA